MREALGEKPAMDDVKKAVVKHFCRAFALRPSKLDFAPPNG
jgi:hypothetical protein